MNWINVRDELPSGSRNCLVCYSYRDRVNIDWGIAWYRSGRRIWEPCLDMLEAENYDGSAHITLGNEVTHWMELPEPPEDE